MFSPSNTGPIHAFYNPIYNQPSDPLKSNTGHSVKPWHDINHKLKPLLLAILNIDKQHVNISYFDKAIATPNRVRIKNLLF